jgi:hypothetical protein
VFIPREAGPAVGSFDVLADVHSQFFSLLTCAVDMRCKINLDKLVYEENSYDGAV